MSENKKVEVESPQQDNSKTEYKKIIKTEQEHKAGLLEKKQEFLDLRVRCFPSKNKMPLPQTYPAGKKEEEITIQDAEQAWNLVDKNNLEFDSIIVLCGKITEGEFKDLYLCGFDIDTKTAFDCFTDGKGVSELKRMFNYIEWHFEPDFKYHCLCISEKPFTEFNEKVTEGLAVKSLKGWIVVSPSKNISNSNPNKHDWQCLEGYDKLVKSVPKKIIIIESILINVEYFYVDLKKEKQKQEKEKENKNKKYKIVLDICKPKCIEGQRNIFILPFAGYLKKKEIQEEEAISIVELMFDNKETDEWTRKVKDTYKKTDLDEVLGADGLRDFLSEDELKTLDKFFDKNEYQTQTKKKVSLDKKPIFYVAKYSNHGRTDLHETVVVDDIPYFVNSSMDLLEQIEESGRIIKPATTLYPYRPYDFESKEELENFFSQARALTFESLYLEVKKIFSTFVDQDPRIIVLLSADCIFTYFQDLFSTTHYNEIVGDNNVGKSTIGYTFESLGYRVVKATAISGANYYRMLGTIEPGQCVIIEDEGDNISEDQDKIRILKTGYEYDAKVPKINMNLQNQDQSWFNTYCFKLILAEKSLTQYKAKGLADRTFTLNCRPGSLKISIKDVVSCVINKSPQLQNAYNEILKIRKLLLCFRLLHYKDPLPQITTGLINRDNELCSPLLQLFFGSVSLKEIVDALEYFLNKKKEIKGKSIEQELYKIIKNRIPQDLDIFEIAYSDIWHDLTRGGYPPNDHYNKGLTCGRYVEGIYDPSKPNQYSTTDYGILYNNTMSTIILDKFADGSKRKSSGMVFSFTKEKLDKFEAVYGENSGYTRIEVAKT